MIKKRFYVSDIRQDLIMGNLRSKIMIDVFGRYFNKEVEADNFMKENPHNTKYIIDTEGKKVISLTTV